MSEESKTAQNRRDFVKTAAKVAVTAPAAAMLLNASAKAQTAARSYGDDYGKTVTKPIDDFGSDNNITVTTGDNFVP